MTDEKKVKYLKIDRGRFYYQRCVPEQFQDILDTDRWQIPCGDVTYAKAVQLVVSWAEEHDDLLAKLRTPEGYASFEAAVLRSGDATEKSWIETNGAKTLYIENGEYVATDDLVRPWQMALAQVAELDKEKANVSAQEHEVLQLKAQIARAKRGEQVADKIKLAPYPELVALAQSHKSEDDILKFEFTPDLSRSMSDERYCDRLQQIYQNFFQASLSPPIDPDDRDEFEFAKRRIERKISSVTPDPNSLSAVLETYLRFNSIRSGTRSKYRREIARLIAITGDVPLNHVRTDDLKKLRDDLIGTIQAASIQAIFTPIKGIFSFALDEGMIADNPMFGVKLPRDKRPIEERKWKPFEPSEVSRILETAELEWGTPSANLSDARREAIHMVVHVLAFSGMRPVEVIRLVPGDVKDNFIRITGSKTDSSTRIVPLHPEIKDFPAWIAAGGLETFQTISTDKVGSVRHNFGRLLRYKMSDPIMDPKKALYSLRSTFVNAMRRAGCQ